MLIDISGCILYHFILGCFFECVDQLRVISGKLKGRKLAAFRGQSVRPTSDRVRESLFNILSVEWEGKTVLDLFAGTGGLGIEAISRGACRVVFIENHLQRTIFKNTNKMAEMDHFKEWIVNHIPVSLSGFPQFAKTRIPTIKKK